MANWSKESYKEENAQLKKCIKELEKVLSFSLLETEVRDLMITRVEEYFNIPIRKKIWDQTIMELVSGRSLKVAPACRLFGRCCQAFYLSKADIVSEMKRGRVIIENVLEIRKEDLGIGGYKLWGMLCALFGSAFMLGRGSFYMLLHRHHLMLPLACRHVARRYHHAGLGTGNHSGRSYKWK